MGTVKNIEEARKRVSTMRYRMVALGLTPEVYMEDHYQVRVAIHLLEELVAKIDGAAAKQCQAAPQQEFDFSQSCKNCGHHKLPNGERSTRQMEPCKTCMDRTDVSRGCRLPMWKAK